MATRSQYYCDIFGNPKELDHRVLPTYRDVMLYFLFVQHDLKNRHFGKDPAVCEILQIVAPNIEKVWQSASIPTVSHRRTWNMLKDFHGRYKKLQNNIKSRKYTANIQSKITAFRNEASHLIDTATCKCEFLYRTCEKFKKVPVLEQPFLKDQRTSRVMAIGSVDPGVSKKIECMEKRKAQAATRLNKSQKMSLQSTSSSSVPASTSASMFSSDNEDEPGTSSMDLSIPNTDEKPIGILLDLLFCCIGKIILYFYRSRHITSQDIFANEA